MEQTRICVVGACNMDLISYVPRLPTVGETLHGSRFRMGFGGKGANQAVMAAKLGGEVTMVAKVGDDPFGSDTRKNFERWRVDVRHVHLTDRAFSGVAPIAVDPEGRNSIIIVTGANDLMTVEEIEAARPAIAGARILVCQLEVPLEISLAALRVAREEGVRTIFNPAPARPDLPEELYRLSDIFCPNESETELLTGMPVGTLEEAEAAARTLRGKGTGIVILTLGERGSLLVTGEVTETVPVETVKAVDTTGAGDAFVGSLAYFLATGKDVQEAMRAANLIAAISVQSPGTQTSFPEVRDLPGSLIDIDGNAEAGKEGTAGGISPEEMAGHIDHTLLKPEARGSTIDALCEEAVRYKFSAVCVNPCHVARAADNLEGSAVRVCSVVGFPLGASDSRAKAFEARTAVEDGADELDMVMNIGALKSGDREAVERDIRAVRDAAGGETVLKVIIETCLLEDREKILACEIARDAGADFVKTSTGLAGGGATPEDVSLMRNAVGPKTGVKASGGIKDFTSASAMISAGANRIGTSSGVEIIKGAGKSS